MERSKLVREGIARAVRMAWKLRHVNRAKARKWIESGRNWQEWEFMA